MHDHNDVSNHTTAVVDAAVVFIVVGTGTSTGTGLDSDIGTSIAINRAIASSFAPFCAFANAKGSETAP